MQLQQNKKVQDFLNQLVEQIKFSDAHDEVRQEYLSHIEESVKLGMSYGLSLEAAIEDAIKRMGNPIEVGRKLCKVHDPKFDLAIALSTSALCAVGIYVLMSLGFAGPQGLWILIGALLGFTLFLLKPRHLIKASPYLYGITILMLLAAHLLGVTHDGQPYLVLGRLKLKIIDLSVVLFLFAVAGLAYRTMKKHSSHKAATVFVTLMPVFYFSIIGSVYSATLYFISALAILFTFNFSWILNGAFTTLSLLIIALGQHNGAFISLESLASLRVTEAHTDFIFYYLTSTAPLLAMTALVGLGLLLARIASVCREIKNPFTLAMTRVTFVLIASATAWGVFSGLGYIPMPQTGVNLPFLSYGGSLMVANLTLIGFSLGAIRRKTLHFN